VRRILYAVGNLALLAIVIGILVNLFQGQWVMPIWMQAIFLILVGLNSLVDALDHFVKWMEDE